MRALKCRRGHGASWGRVGGVLGVFQGNHEQTGFVQGTVHLAGTGVLGGGAGHIKGRSRPALSDKYKSHICDFTFSNSYMMLKTS